MNFNEEMDYELKPLRLGGRIVEIKEEDKGTPQDWAELQRKIDLRCEQNEKMILQSRINAQKSILG